VPDSEIAGLMARERGGFVTLPKPPKVDSGFHPDDRLRVRSGPLIGCFRLCAGMSLARPDPRAAADARRQPSG